MSAHISTTFSVIFAEEKQPISIVSAGFFAFPKIKTHPLFYGFAAEKDQETALAKARKEAIQRFSFLWGEEIPSESPALAPSPYFHQEYFLYPENGDKIRAWLQGEYKQKLKTIAPRKNAIDESFSLLDLTPTSLKNKIVVLKAISTQRMPLIFGSQDDLEIDSELAIHPII